MKDADKPYLEAVFENSEVIIDSILDSSVITDIPVVGTAFKLCKSLDDIRNRAFVAKVQKFLEGTEVDKKLKEKIKSKLLVDSDELNKVGESLILIIDRATDISKTELYGNIFLAYIDNIISLEELQRLCQAIDSAFIDDIFEFMKASDLPLAEDGCIQYLSSSGLARAVGGGSFDNSDKIFYKPSELGQKLRTVYEYIQKLKTC